MRVSQHLSFEALEKVKPGINGPKLCVCVSGRMCDMGGSAQASAQFKDLFNN